MLAAVISASRMMSRAAGSVMTKGRRGGRPSSFIRALRALGVIMLFYTFAHHVGTPIIEKA